jgi:protein-S-isoprenylcysteine O-methyltransferase Ste14
MKTLKVLVGSGDKIGLFVLPFVIAGLGINFLFPSLFATPQSDVLTGAGYALLLAGLVVWAWSVLLILTEVPKGRLITSGPYALVKHPLYTGVSLLVLPGLGFALGTWLGLLFGVVLYVASRIFAPEEEKGLAGTFGPDWDAYVNRVRVSWL